MESDSKLKVGVLIVLLSIIGSCIYFLFFYSHDIENPKYTVGTCIGTTYGSKGTVLGLFEYRVDNQIYTTAGPEANIPLVFSDKFIICYNVKNPKDVKVIKEKPIFLDRERTSFVTGHITGKTSLPSFRTNFVTFKYQVSGEWYKRYQYFPTEDNVKGVRGGDKYEVEYWEENPQRSIINLSKKY